MLNRFDLVDTILPQIAKQDLALAWAIYDLRRRIGPRPAQTRRLRAILASVGVPVSSQLYPTICNDFLVTSVSHVVDVPDTFFPGNIGRYDAAYKLGKVPGIDVTIQSQGDYAYRFTEEEAIQTVSDRQGGDPLEPSCTGCWVIRYCDFLSGTFTLRQALAASHVPLTTTIVFKGYELSCKLADVPLDRAGAFLREKGILAAT